MAHIKARKFESKTLLLEFNDDGIVARTEASSKDDSIDIITSGLKTAASIVAPLLPFGPGGTAVGTESLKRKENIADEEYFKSQLSPRAFALYMALDQNTRDRLRYHFGYPFLLFVVRGVTDNANDSVGIEFFFTLNKKQWGIIEKMPHSTAPCESLPPVDPEVLKAAADAAKAAAKAAKAAAKAAPKVAGGGAPAPPVAPVAAPAVPPVNCLSAATLAELARALKVYSKIQQLKVKRQEYLDQSTPAQVAASTYLEFRLKQVDDQIKTLEQTYFLGSSSETSAIAKFEFKPTPAMPGPPPIAAVLVHNLFTYSAGGPKPGICFVDPEVAGVFKALWPKPLGGNCYTPSPNFQDTDIRDLKALAAKLATGAAAGGDPVSTYLYPHLPNAGPLLKHTDTPQQREALTRFLIIDLNNLINGGASIYNAAVFQNVQLSADAIKLINNPALNPAPLNRLLIEDAFAKEIFKPAAWSPLQVTLKVDPATPGFATTVDHVQLKQEGERGFPYRVPAMTMAHLIDNSVERGRSDVRIAQFGPVQSLPAALGGRRSSYKITYYDASGAIKVFDMSTDALIQQKNVTDLTDAATTLRDAEAARLKRETDLINARKAKLDAEKALREAQAAAEPSPSPTPTPQ